MYHLELLMLERQKELLNAADRYRLLSQVKQGPPRWRRLSALALIRLGTRLRTWGYVLQERFGDAEMRIPSQNAKNYA